MIDMNKTELTPFQKKLLSYELHSLINRYPLNQTGISFEGGEKKLNERIDEIIDLLKKP